MAITASEARKSLFPLIEQVNDDHKHRPVRSSSRNKDGLTTRTGRRRTARSSGG
jgi:PHD/YefM family antitoxin component YafN of YafNO toxin-antitoxin module